MPRPPTTRTGHDGLTALALAAGLAFGHIVEAMNELGQGAATLPAAIVFVGAASASTLCVLATLAAPRDGAGLRPRLTRWVVCLGLGFVAAQAPGLL